MPGAAYINPTAFGDLEGVNLGVWVFSHLFAESKFMSIFSILIGAGILIFFIIPLLINLFFSWSPWQSGYFF